MGVGGSRFLSLLLQPYPSVLLWRIFGLIDLDLMTLTSSTSIQSDSCHPQIENSEASSGNGMGRSRRWALDVTAFPIRRLPRLDDKSKVRPNLLGLHLILPFVHSAVEAGLVHSLLDCRYNALLIRHRPGHSPAAPHSIVGFAPTGSWYWYQSPRGDS